MVKVMVNNDRQLIRYYLLILLIILASSVIAIELPDLQVKTLSVPFEMDQPRQVSIPDRTFLITDFGAVGDGVALNTNAINAAISACTNAGGGRVVIPEGVWFTGPVHLASNVDLHLEKGALLRFSPDFDLYPLVKNYFEGYSQVRCTSPINAVGLENVAITGDGIIDGSGEAWRPVKRFKMTSRQWNELLSSGGVVNSDDDVWWPTRSAMNGAEYLESLQEKDSISLQDYAPARDFLRPVMVRLFDCERVLIDGPVFQNSPAWNIHPLMCKDMIIRNITVRNPWYSQNGDGLDLESCKNVLLYDCEFDVGDDAICIKSGRDEYGRQRGIPSENIIIKDCTVYHGHGGVTTGSEMSGGVHNVLVKDCVFMGTDIGIRFKSVRGRGGIVKNMYFDNVRMINIKNEAILFDLFYESDFNGDVPKVDEGTPHFKDIFFKDITSLNAETSVFIRGLPEMAVEGIYFENMLASSNEGIVCAFSRDIHFDNINLLVNNNPVINIHQSSDIQISFTDNVSPKGPFIRVSGENSKNIHLTGPGFDLDKPVIDYGNDTKSDAVRIGLVK